MEQFYPEGSEIELTQPSLVLIRRGQIELLMEEKTPQIVEEGEFCGEEDSRTTASFPDEEPLRTHECTKSVIQSCFEKFQSYAGNC